MNAQELFKRVGKEDSVFETTHRWFCGKCGQIKHDKNLAESCCKPTVCVCGKEVEEEYYTTCRVCRDELDRKRERDRFDKSERLTEWDGPVFLGGYGYNEGYFENIEEFLDCFADEELEASNLEYVWCCDKVPLANLDLDSILEDSTQEAYDGFEYDDFKGLEELRAAIDKFNELNKDVVSWTPNYKKCLLLDRQIKNSELTLQP